MKTKSLINTPLWSMFAFYGESLHDYGLAKEDISVTAKRHPFKRIVQITVKFEKPTLRDVPYMITINDNGDKGIVYLVYLDSLENIEQGLGILEDTGKDPSKLGTGSFRNGLNTVLATPYMDADGKSVAKRQRPKGFINGFPHFVNRGIYIPSQSDVESFISSDRFQEAWKHIINNDFVSAERKFIDVTHNIPDCISQVFWAGQQWALKSKRPKIEDIYLSFDLKVNDDEGKIGYSVVVGLDVANPITDNDESFVIARRPIVPEEWMTEQSVLDLNNGMKRPWVIGDDIEEFTAIRKFKAQERRFNEELARLADIVNQYEPGSLMRMHYEDMFRNNIQTQIIKAVNMVWKFNDTCEEGRVIVERECSEIIDLLNELGKDSPVYLDVTNIIMHRLVDGQSVQLPEEEQVIGHKYRRYMASFGDAMQVGLIATQSPLLKPLVVLKAVSDGNSSAGPIIEADKLLARENEMFPSGGNRVK